MDITEIKTKYKYAQMSFYSFILITVAASLAESSTQTDWPLYFVPFIIVTYFWSASAIRKLAMSLKMNGLVYGWLAILLPVVGAIVGYFTVGGAAKKQVRQIRWKGRKD